MVLSMVVRARRSSGGAGGRSASSNGGEESPVKFGVEHGDALALGSEGVGVGVREPGDQSVEAESAKVVAHLVGAVVGAEQSGHEPAKALVGEAGDGVNNTAQGAGQGHGA
jgi:hypothetical protein